MPGWVVPLHPNSRETTWVIGALWQKHVKTRKNCGTCKREEEARRFGRQGEWFLRSCQQQKQSI